MTRRLPSLPYLLLMAAVVLLDQGTKALVVRWYSR